MRYGRFGNLKKWNEIFLAISLFFVGVPLGQAQAEFDYSVDAEIHADNCEYFVESLALGARYLYYGVQESYLDFRIHVNHEELIIEDGSTILNIGAYTKSTPINKGVEKDPIEANFTAVELGGREYKLLLPTETNGFVSTTTWNYKQIALFMDLQKPSGKIYRFWLVDGDKDFAQLEIIGGYETTPPQWDRDTTLFYVDEDSPIYNQKYACQ